MQLAFGRIGGGLIWVGAAAAGERQPLVVNAHTGPALSGFDPVAYFTDSKPEFGWPDLKLRREGAVWRFRNEGTARPSPIIRKVYTPGFGGYDPVAVARGSLVPGHPLFWAVSGERLYLFHSAEARAQFLADRGGIIARATHKWPDVAQHRALAHKRSAFAFSASPQAMNAGMRKLASAFPNTIGAPCGSVTTPPAAATTA